MSHLVKRLFGELPEWMNPTHPVMKSRLQAKQSRRPKRLTRLLGNGIVFMMLVFIGYNAVSHSFSRNPFDLPISQMLYEAFVYPVFLVQLVMIGTVISSTVGFVGHQQRQQVWDTLRVTAQGTALTFRTHWTYLLFYGVRRMMILVIGARFILIGALLYDLTAFQGEYLRYLLGATDPNIPLWMGIILLATTLTASLLLPFTTLGFDAALGLVLSTFVKQRTYVVLIQVLLIGLRLFFATLLLLALSSFESTPLQLSSSLTNNLITWGVIFMAVAIGDWGFSLLYLGFYGEQIWRDVPYGVFIGVAVMIYVMVQAIVTDMLLNYAIRRAD
jgi:hypothetical protein